MKLSLCIPTFNEEKFIHYPLDSAYEMVDEVIIVDGGSTDKTVEKVKSYGEKVKVHNVDNPPNFLLNKQRAIEYAKGEWILQLDADEALSKELIKEIRWVLSFVNPPASAPPASAGDCALSSARRRIHSRHPSSNSENLTPSVDNKIVGYWVPRKNYFLGRYLMKGGMYPDYVLRLYKREGAHFKLENVHENVMIKGETGYLKNAVLHYADPNFSRYLKRWDKYTSFDADLLAQAKKDASFIDLIEYFFLKPTHWFLKTYFRHKGFMDGFPGFIFSLFSSIRFWAIYIKWWQKINVGRGDEADVREVR